MWIKLTSSIDDQPILINTDHVEAITANDQDSNTNVCLANQNQAYYVKEGVSQIFDLINKKDWN